MKIHKNVVKAEGIQKKLSDISKTIHLVVSTIRIVIIYADNAFIILLFTIRIINDLMFQYHL